MATMAETQPFYKTLLVPDVDWVTIPAGEFIYGERNNQNTQYLEAFEIARYPVTNVQYQCFIDDGGYEDEQWWTGLKKRDVEKSEWPLGNRPRTNVNWYEAIAFTRWLSNRLNQAVRLPTEHEWEKAARGEKGLEYPWGNGYEAGHANVDESSVEGGVHLRQTVAVGLYPRDESPEGVRDMAGNVLEWCSNDYEKHAKKFDFRGSAVLRGSTWRDPPVHAGTSVSYGDLPELRSVGIGFRLLRSPLS